MKKIILFFAGLSFLTSCKNTAENKETQEGNLIVSTENGKIEGFLNEDQSVRKYFGVPFAQPPVGDLRWKAPQDAKNWSDTLATKEFKNKPVQANVFRDMKSRSNGMSEDCLYLNVWTPMETSEEKLPVLVYFYGGGFVAGDASEPRYDGETMAKKGMVVVTVNYRLNIFGFMAHPELSEEAPYNASGNYGLLDQQKSLEWVQANIAAFGGDPKKVTIAGESAGSISVSAQMASPLSKDLINGAIGESGASIYPTLAPVSLEEAEKTGIDFAEQIGAKSLANLRAMSTDSIFMLYQNAGRFGFPTVIDNYFLPKSLPEIFEAKEQAQVPLLVGWNSAEIPGMGVMQGLENTPENFIKKVKEIYPEDHEEVLKLYPHNTSEEVKYSATKLASDRFIVYSTWKWFDLHRKNSDAPVYRYLYSKLRPELKDQSKQPGLAGGTQEKDENTPEAPKAVGAPHAAEIEYFMGNLDRIEDYAWTEEDYKVSETIQKYLANFVKTGNPNTESLPEWPKAEANDQTPPVMILDTESKAENSEDDKRFLFLDKDYTK
ncbi:carboxylesterase family protein [Zunongwangia sp. SCSIO 43204]|uniref:carboxylesterase/lipase family protein n=1 Tax=Zunongwangia sp. SCSIO 43204 TaxID=2779359 RepID=UPI001CA820C4|nr:carboxylesterase family protein [Zunongwangia sp. SCSIO 43204]UAB85636.1 carboxylesterase family protein [Zunongwangia sp. SCSIO 43204]